MDKRSRSWKLKSSYITSASNGSLESSSIHPNKHPDSQVVSEVLPDHCSLSSDEPTVMQGKDKVKYLHQKFSSALGGVSDKGELIKIYLTFTQAAFSGWEKSEAETEILRQDLDFALQQKLAAEDRVSHLDGSLKENKQQLRQLREEQEENIHEAIAKSRKEWEKIKSELEEKLTDLQQKFVEKEAENKEISKTLQKRVADIEKISEAHSRAKAELNVLKNRIESIEKENAVLKFECMNNLKEKHTIIIDEKKNLAKKSTKLSQRKTLEDLRKVAKTARDKKLNYKEKPALERSQDKKENNNRKISKDIEVSEVKTSNPRARMIGKESLLVGKYTNVLQERLSAMEEETRRLKDLLEKKDNELLHMRYLSEQTANKLSEMEEKLESSYNQVTLTSNSHCVDGNCDSSTVTGELSYPKVDNVTTLCALKEHPTGAAHGLCDQLFSNLGNIGNELASSQCDNMDLTLPNTEKFKVISLPIGQMILKLRNAENELSENVSAQERLQNFYAQFDIISPVQDHGGDLKAVLNQARETVGVDEEPSLASATCRLVETIKNMMMKLACILNKRCVHWEEAGRDTKKRSIEQLCSICVHGKMDIVTLFEDLSSSLEGFIKLEWLRNDPSQSCETPDVLNGIRTPTNSGTISLHEAEESSFLDSNSVPCIENRISNNTQVITSYINEVELTKVYREKAALETHMGAEFQRFHELEEDLAKALDEKLELDNKLNVANAELEQVKAKIFRFEQIEANLWAEFMSAKSSSQLIDDQLCGINLSSEASESQLKIILVEWSRLQYRVEVLEREVRDKQEKNVLLEANCQRFMDQLLRYSNFICSKCQAVHCDGEPAIKGFRTKSSKSWQFKLMLGKPLKVLTLHKGEQMKEPHESTNEETTSQGRVSTYLEEEEEEYQQDDDDKVSSLLEVHLRNGRKGWRKYHGEAKKEVTWRHGSAADILDWELASLSQSGRPLAELFGDKTPEHDHYIQAVEELPSSSDEESLSSPTHARPAETTLGRKKKSNDRTRSMNAGIHSDKHSKSFSRLFFSRGKRVHSFLRVSSTRT